MDRELFYIKQLKPDINQILDPKEIKFSQIARWRMSMSLKKIYENRRPWNVISVYQYDLCGKFIKKFDAISDAASECNVQTTVIANATKSKSHVGAGYM